MGPSGVVGGGAEPLGSDWAVCWREVNAESQGLGSRCLQVLHLNGTAAVCKALKEVGSRCFGPDVVKLGVDTWAALQAAASPARYIAAHEAPTSSFQHFALLFFFFLILALFCIFFLGGGVSSLLRPRLPELRDLGLFC